MAIGKAYLRFNLKVLRATADSSTGFREDKDVF
jgi:hypothetical protein